MSSDITQAVARLKQSLEHAQEHEFKFVADTTVRDLALLLADLARAHEDKRALREALDDSRKCLEVARRALGTAQERMASIEMQDSRWDNARDLVYTAKIAAYATTARIVTALSATASPEPANKPQGAATEGGP